MPLFYYDLPSDRDDMGVDLPDAAAARAYAVRYASEVIRDLDVTSCDPISWRMDVRGDDAATLFALVIELGPIGDRARSDEGWAGGLRRVG